MKIQKSDGDFNSLVKGIKKLHESLSANANRAVNTYLTLRNWTIGFYIHSYEQNGSDRARYGERLLKSLASRLGKLNIPRTNQRELRRYRQFYLVYPQIGEPVTPRLKTYLPKQSHFIKKRESVTPKFTSPVNLLLERLSFTHFSELLSIDDPLKRAFYEHESIQGNWSVRELKRQIASLYFERTGLSKNKKKLAALTRAKHSDDSVQLTIRDPYVFEFLGLRSKEVMGESHLEDALLDKLQEFLLELGHGFCFEARQKRINIGGEYYFVDLLFYHRILKCHILIELKVDDFKHEYLGQLNTYLSYYRKNEIVDGDNPPVGILLCTKKNRALVEYALADMSNKLFVSKYSVELPSKKEIQKFMEEELKEQS
ncbi:MAG: PDDEXK nuclease domain-containing protein [Pseudomonadota bacterium]